jgi:uncharacterized protein (DUF302 family)
LATAPIHDAWGEFVFYIVESDKSFYEACFDLEPVVQRLGFVVLHSHDLAAMLRGTEAEPDDECKIFEIANYRHSEKMLALDMRLSLLLPWRIAVFTQNGATKVGLLRPQAILAELGPTPELSRLAGEIEERMVQIVDEVR